MSVAGGIMVPHPPLIIPEIGQGEERGIQATIDAYHQAAKALAAWRPDTVVVLSPHTVMYADYFHISPGDGAKGDFGRFRAPQVKFQVEYDRAFGEELERESDRASLPAGTMGEQDRRLDHGTMVPLYFLEKYLEGGLRGCRFVRVGLSGLPLSRHYELGQCIQRTAGKLARKAVETYVRTGRRLEMPSDLPDELYRTRAGAFVSLKEEGRLRGCIGTIAPAASCLAREIMDNAVSAAARDPRFFPVRAEELERLVYSVDVLGETEPIASLQELDVKRYGVVVSRGRKRGLLLPDLEGVDTPEEQVAIAKRKAGIPEDEEDVRLERFEVVRHR